MSKEKWRIEFSASAFPGSPPLRLSVSLCFSMSSLVSFSVCVCGFQSLLFCRSLSVSVPFCRSVVPNHFSPLLLSLSLSLSVSLALSISFSRLTFLFYVPTPIFRAPIYLSKPNCIGLILKLLSSFSYLIQKFIKSSLPLLSLFLSISMLSFLFLFPSVYFCPTLRVKPSRLPQFQAKTGVIIIKLLAPQRLHLSRQ